MASFPSSFPALPRAEIERVGRMTIEDRVKTALSMGQRFSWVKEIAKQD